MTKRFPWGLTMAASIALAILVSLGVWQLYRLQWKEGILARRAALAGAEARPIDQALNGPADPATLDMIRISVTCPGLAKAPTQRVFSIVDGLPVNRLMSVCHPASLASAGAYDGILVDRGHVPEEVETSPLIDPADVAPLTLTGVLRKPVAPNAITRLITPAPTAPRPGHTRLWMDYDLPGIGAALGVKHPWPVFIAAETSTNPDWPALVPGLPVAEIPNNHLQYALTWFGLAIVMLCFYAAMLQKRLKGP